jgi:hypothetical protein
MMWDLRAMLPPKNGLHCKRSCDRESLKSEIAQKKHDLDARRAENRTDRLEWEASVAVDYTIAAVEQAEVAVLDAVAARMKESEARSGSSLQSGAFNL